MPKPGPLLLALSASILPATAIPAFPGAEGYGANAVGGRNGEVYHVTNLNASGPGSFADAIGTVPSAGRTIVFDVSGYIRLPSGSNGTRLTSSKVTIAGQTAPGDGIGFYNNFFRISGDDIVIRHVRFRHGYYGSGGDCVDLDSGCLNAILDHVSMQFSTDENMSSFSSPPENLTLQYSLNAWGLESHSCGGLWDQNHATSHHNLWAHNHTRNPKARPGGLLEWVNNVTFDWDIGFIMGDSTSNANWKANVINNYFICPPGNIHSKALVSAHLGTNGLPNFTVHLNGNLSDTDGDGLLNGTDKGYGIVEGTSYTQSALAIAGSTVGVSTDSPLTAYKKIVSNSGALRLDASYPGALRDEVDTILIDKLTTQTRFHVTRESATSASNAGFGTLAGTPAAVDTDRDGMPDYYETGLGWNVATDDHATALASSGGIISGTTFFPPNTPAGYTRLEEYLHYLAIPHASVPKNISGTPSSVQVDLRRFTAGFSAAPSFNIAAVSNGTATQYLADGVTVSATGPIVKFTPTLNFTGRARFDFTVTDSSGSSWTQTMALLVSQSGLPRDLLWKGSGNTWDTASATNWLRPVNGSTAAYSDGDRVSFDQTGIAQPNVSISGTLAPTTVEVDATGSYRFGGSGSISSAGTLTKRSSGTLTLGNAETYSGGTLLEAGTLAIANPGSLAGGALTMLDGTTLTNAYPTGTSSSLAAGINVPTGGSATLNTGNRISYSGPLTGGGTLNCNVQTTVARVDFKGSTAAFTGKLNFTNGGGVRLFFNGGSFNGFDNADIDLGGSVSLQPQTNSGGNTLNIAALSGASASANLAGGSAGPVAYVIGSNGKSTSYAGTITGNASLTKTGTGTLTLGGASNYTGTTSVNTGWLLVDGSLGSSAVSISSGAFLGGSGSMGGGLNASAGATLSPGTPPFTGVAMTVNGGLGLNGNTLYYDMTSSPGGANDKIAMGGGNLALSGTQNFQFWLIDGTLSPGPYDLISGAATTSGTPAFTHNLPTGTRQTFALGMSGTTVRLTVTGSPATITWTGASSSNWDSATANNWTGATPNTFSTYDAVVFDDSSGVNNISIPSAVSPRSTTFNNTTRAYTLGGAAGISSGALIKNGAGALTLSGSNSPASTTINAGATISFANDTANASALGTGPITLNGGTLTMYNNQSGFSSSTMNLIVPAGQTGTLNADSRHDIYGTLTGGGTLNFRVPWIRTSLFSDWSAFTGTLNATTDADGGDLRMSSNYYFSGFPLAAVNLSDKVTMYYDGILAEGAGTTIEIGELSGAAKSVLQGGPTGGRNFTYHIGARTAAAGEAVFAGSISERSADTTTSIIKTGAGTWTLSGSGTWNGGTTIEQGTLKISGSINCNAALNANPAATLALAGGSISADTVNIAAGADLTGQGSINCDLNNNGTTTSTAGGQLTVTGDVVNNGTIRLTNSSSLNATGAFINNGVLDLLTAGSGLPPNLVNNGAVIDSSAVRAKSCTKSGASFTLTIDSYAGHGYRLQRRTTLNAGTWQDVGGSQTGLTQENGTPTVLNFTDPAAPAGSCFYRIQVSP